MRIGGIMRYFYRRNDAFSVSRPIINTESNRVSLCAIRLWCDDYDLLLVNVYIPCESDDAFCSVLSTINSRLYANLFLMLCLFSEEILMLIFHDKLYTLMNFSVFVLI